jgi:hypothetical protein
VLYRLPQLRGQIVAYVVEGEKDADALAALIRAEPRVAAVALIRGPIDNPKVVVLSANVPRPAALVGAPNFRRVATAL